MPRLTEENRKWWILLAMTLSLSMVLIDQTVVSVALPTIQRELDMSQTELQWVVNAYLLSLAVFVAAGGRLGDILGQSRMFRLGGILFVAASGLCGLAQEDWWLLGARALQGVGAAVMIPASGAIVINAFRPEERGKAMGIYAGISMVFLALGPLLGGVLTEWVTWRAVFYINLPIGIVMVLLAHVVVPRDEPERGARMDWTGFGALVVGLSALVLALMQGETWGWGSFAVIGLFVLAAVFIPVFVILELRHRESPLIQLRLFRSRNFSGDTLVLTFVEFALTGLTVFGSIWIQNVLAFTPIEAGLALLPMLVPLIVVAPQVGKLYDRLGPRGLVTFGATLTGAGLIWAAAVLSQEDYLWLVPGYVVMGIGIGCVMGPSNTDAMNAAAVELRGQASGVLQTFRQVGGTLGIAVMGTIVANVQSNRIDAVVESDPNIPASQKPELERALSESQGSTTGHETLPSEILEGLQDAITSAVSAAEYTGGGVMLFVAVLAFAVLRHVRAADAPDEGAATGTQAGAHLHPALAPAAQAVHRKGR